MILKQLQAAYLDYINDYLTVDKYAEHNGLTAMQAVKILQIGKELHESGGFLADK